MHAWMVETKGFASIEEEEEEEVLSEMESLRPAAAADWLTDRPKLVIHSPPVIYGK